MEAGSELRSASAQAEAALECAREEPDRAREQAGRALALAEQTGDHAAKSVAQRALGLAARERHDLEASLDHLRRAVRIAERHGHVIEAGRARISLFGTLAYGGDFAGALREADRAAATVRGVDRARLELQRAVVLMWQGERLDEALGHLNRAIRPFRRAGERSLEAAALHNRGLVHCYRGAMRAAEADLHRAMGLRQSLDQHRLVAILRHDLGFVASRRGDIPVALAWFDEAEAYFRAHGISDPIGWRSRCEVLLRARLVTEARKTAQAAVDELSRAGMQTHLAEARLMLAEAAVLDGDPETAGTAARQARRAFARQARPRHEALASYLETKASWQAGERSARLLRAARHSAAALEAAGWTGPAQDARLIAGRVAQERGQPLIAERELASAAARRDRGPVEPRVRGWHAEALRRLAAGNRRGAGRALAAGIRLVDRHRAVLGATDLRAHASGHAAELAELGLHLALERGRARGVLDWAERWRAGALSTMPAAPASDRRLEGQLARLRHAASEVEQAALEGRRTAPLLRRQAELERSVQQLARHRTGGPTAAARTGDGPLDLGALSNALGDRALVEFVELDGRLHAVTVVDGRARLTALAGSDEVAAESESLGFAVRRLAYGRGSPAAQDAARAAFAHSRARLDELLLAPLSGMVGDRELVIVPTGALHALAWAALPSCTGRAVAVAPSVDLWSRVATAPAEGSAGPTVLVCGPDLAWADEELAELSRHHPGATVLAGHDATVDKVAAALDGAGLAHVAAHCRFRSDNPLLSSVRLADGGLTVYDVERLGAAPRQLVLSACESGLADVSPGDELRGFVAAMFALGTRTVIGSVMPVPDAAIASLMAALHAELAAGALPATALARVQAAAGDADADLAAAAGLVCFGAP